MITSVAVFVFLLLLALCALLNLVTLPGNWIIFVLVLLWSWLGPEPLGMFFFAVLTGLALLGELFDFVTQLWGAKKYGSTNKGALGGMIGAVIGALMLAPFMFGLGAALGALAGAWLGSFGAERLRGMPMDAAITAANGSLMGRFLGMVLKFGIGLTMGAWTAWNIWEKAML